MSVKCQVVPKLNQMQNQQLRRSTLTSQYFKHHTGLTELFSVVFFFFCFWLEFYQFHMLIQVFS